MEFSAQKSDLLKELDLVQGVVEKKTTVVENHTTVRHDNGNHYGQDKDKMSNPAARGDNGKHDDKDKKGVAKNE